MSNQPLFDDDDLPAWLKNAGITYGGSGNQPESSTPAPSSNDDMSWLEQSSQSAPAGALPFDAGVPWDGSEDNAAFDTIPDAPDWMQGLHSTPVSDAPAPWMASPEPTNAVENTSSGGLPWESAPTADSDAAPGPGMTGALPWRQGASDPTDQPAATNDNDLSWLDQQTPATQSTPTSEDLAPWQNQAEPETAASGADDLSWLNAGPPTLPKPPSSEPVSSEPVQVTADDLGWLNEQPAPEPPAAEPPRPAIRRLPPANQPPAAPAAPPAAPPSADQPRPAIRRLPPANQPPADQPRPAAIKKLPTAPPPPPSAPPPDYSNMTYEEWERAQAQADEQAQADPADQLLDEVPDWFKSGDAPAESSTGTGPLGEFMPEWFVGQEEQPADAAPDWFKDTDFTNTPLVGPDSIQTQAPAPAPAAPTADETPDWFKGAEVEGIDFDSMFVAETPPDAPKSTGGLSAKLAELTPDTPPPPDVVERAPEIAEPAKPEEPVAAPVDMAPVPDEPLPGAEDIVAADPVDVPPIQDEPLPVIDEIAPVDMAPVAEVAPAVDDLDWMDMPDLDDLTGGVTDEAPAIPEPAAPIEEPQAERTSIDDLDWMSAPVEVTPPEEEPEADIASADMPDWMSQMAAEVPPASSASVEEPEADIAPADMPDWMGQMATEAPPASSESVEEPESDIAPAEIPDWMSQMAAEVPAAPSLSVEEPDADLAPAGDMPDWMRQMAAESSAAPVAPTAEPQANPGADVPDWMRQMAAEAPAADTPDWMRDMAPIGETPMAEPEQSQPQGQYDWLNDFDANSKAPAAEPVAPPSDELEAVPVPSASAPVDIDALLNFAETSTPPEPEPVVEEEAPAPAVDEFDFEAELEPIISAEESTPNSDTFDAATLDFDALLAAGNAAEPAGPELPAEPAQPEAPVAAPEPPVTSPRLRRLTKTGEMPAVSATQAAEAAPEWVEAMQPASGPVVLRIGDQEVRAEERPANILPEELQSLRERARAFAQRSPAVPAATAGPLAGITGAIDATPEPAQPITSAGAASLIVSDLDARRIKIIQSILGGEEEMLQERLMGDEEREAKEAAAGIKPAAPARPRPKIDRIIISLLLAAVVVAPFFTGVLNFTVLPDTTQLTAAQSSVKDAVDAIPPDQDVLVAFEYGPTGAGEMDDLARVIVRDIVKRGAHPVIVSTNPTGALHAQSVMQSLATNATDLTLMNRANKPLIVRQDYWVLPYLPGGAVGVHSLLNAVMKNNASQLQFRTDIEGQPTGLTDVSITTLQRNPVFVLTESEEDVRNWVEQYQASGPNQVKLVLLSSAAASAAAQTYVGAAADKHIVGPLVGLRDAMTYQAVRQPLPAGTATGYVDQRWQSIGLATLVAALLILAGAAYNVIRGVRRTRR